MDFAASVYLSEAQNRTAWWWWKGYAVHVQTEGSVEGSYTLHVHRQLPMVLILLYEIEK